MSNRRKGMKRENAKTTRSPRYGLLALGVKRSLWRERWQQLTHIVKAVVQLDQGSKGRIKVKAKEKEKAEEQRESKRPTRRSEGSRPATLL